MNLPLSFSSDVPNNIHMREIPEAERVVDQASALSQFLELYHYVAAESAVFLLPTPPSPWLQDLVFTSNLAIVLTHLPQTPVVLSNFTSKPRRDEPAVGKCFFESMGYNVHDCPFRFEGEAELKHIGGSVYLGAHGIRSESRAYDWMQECFDMKIIPVENHCEYLYHLDCFCFPLAPRITVVCTKALGPKTVHALEKETEIIDVSVEECRSGLANCVRLSRTVLNNSHIHDLRAGTPEYEAERNKNRRLEDIAVANGMDLALFNLSEFLKGGADLSCLFLHLNRRSYEIPLM